MIGIIFLSNLKYCPYLKRYIDTLNESNESIEVIYWNREGISENIPGVKTYSYNNTSKLNKNILLKIPDFIGFGKFAKRVIEKRKYEKLIILTTLTGIIIKDVLEKYKNRYILDIRDYSYEHIYFLKKIEDTIIRNSTFTVLSSQGFKNFLPDFERYVLAHNFDPNEITKEKRRANYIKGSIVNLTFTGSVRHLEHDIKFADKFSKDKRFLLTYNGSGSSFREFKDYIDRKGYENVILTGAYNHKAKKNIMKKVDIINNNYPHNRVTKYAVSNKFYDGLIYRVPQLVTKNTFSHELVDKYKVGLALDINEEGFNDKLWNYMQNTSFDEINPFFDKALDEFLKEDKMFIDAIREFQRS